MSNTETESWKAVSGVLIGGRGEAPEQKFSWKKGRSLISNFSRNSAVQVKLSRKEGELWQREKQKGDEKKAEPRNGLYPLNHK